MHPYMNDVLSGSCSATGEGVTATEKIFQAVGRLSKFQVEIGVKKVIGSVLLGTFKMISVVPSSICQATCLSHYSCKVHSMPFHPSCIK